MKVTVVYRRSADYWGAECLEVPELAAGDMQLEALRSMVRAALEDYLDAVDLHIVEVIEPSANFWANAIADTGLVAGSGADASHASSSGSALREAIPV